MYGVCVGGVFFGESMFSKSPDASKIAFVMLVRQMEKWGRKLVDCQMPTDHLRRFGASEVPRERFLAELAELIKTETVRGKWSFDQD